MLTLQERATRFADAWYARSEYGRDASTLAYLLVVELESVAEAARADERRRIAAKLATLTEAP